MWTVYNFQYNNFHKEKKVDTQITGTVIIVYTVDDLQLQLIISNFQWTS